MSLVRHSLQHFHPPASCCNKHDPPLIHPLLQHFPLLVCCNAHPFPSRSLQHVPRLPIATLCSSSKLLQCSPFPQQVIATCPSSATHLSSACCNTSLLQQAVAINTSVCCNAHPFPNRSLQHVPHLQHVSHSPAVTHQTGLVQ